MRENWKYSTIGESCNINYGTRVVRKRDGGSIYDVYGGGGATFKMDTYNREDCLVVSRFAMSPKCTRFVSGKFFLNDSGLTLSPKKDTGLGQAFMNTILLANNDNIYKYGRGSAQRNLKVDEFCTMPISYPKSLSEQERIVALLDDQFAKIDALKANATSQLQAAKDLFQSALKQLLTPKEGWEEERLGHICKFQNGFAFKSKDFVKEGVGVVRISDIQNGEVLIDDMVYILPETLNNDMSSFMVYPNDILIAMSGGTTGKIGINKTNKTFFQNQRVGLFRENQKRLVHYYLYYFLLTKTKESLDIAAGSAQPNLSTEQIKNFIVPLPPLPEQQQIVTRLDAISERVKQLQDNYDKTITLCNDLKQALLKSIFA